MPRYLAALTIVLFVGMVVTRLLLLKKQGFAALKFGDPPKPVFLIPPLAFFSFSLFFAAAFGLPPLSTKDFFPSGSTSGSEWHSVLRGCHSCCGASFFLKKVFGLA